MTTILTIRDAKQHVMIADKTITLGETILKNNENKVIQIDGAYVGLAGAVADAENFIERLKAYYKELGDMVAAIKNLKNEWVASPSLPDMDALLLIMFQDCTYLIHGKGNYTKFTCDVNAIGSGSNIAKATARALRENTKLDASAIAKKTLRIVSEIDLYTGKNYTLKVIDRKK